MHREMSSEDLRLRFSAVNPSHPRETAVRICTPGHGGYRAIVAVAHGARGRRGVFGPLVLFGLGGTPSDLLADPAARLTDRHVPGQASRGAARRASVTRAGGRRRPGSRSGAAGCG